jgi:general secretion pathway protein F
MRYEVKAVKAGGAVVSLGLDARDDRDANQQAQSQGYTVLSVRRAGAAALPSLRSARFPLVLFTQELLALLRSGISLVEALETLAEKDSRASSGPVLAGLLEKLREGQSFSSALQGVPDRGVPGPVRRHRARQRAHRQPVGGAHALRRLSDSARWS